MYVARFHEDGTGEWLELSPANPALAAWTIEDILVNTRTAADAVGATPMDRPEWIAVGRDQQVFCTLTNNTQRGAAGRPGADAANPLAPNPWGHIIRWVDADQHTGTTFEWDIFAIAQDTVDAGGQMFGSPDGLWADRDGRVFVETDGAQPGGNNDQLLVAHASTPASSGACSRASPDRRSPASRSPVTCGRCSSTCSTPATATRTGPTSPPSTPAPPGRSPATPRSC